MNEDEKNAFEMKSFLLLLQLLTLVVELILELASHDDLSHDIEDFLFKFEIPTLNGKLN